MYSITDFTDSPEVGKTAYYGESSAGERLSIDTVLTLFQGHPRLLFVLLESDFPNVDAI